VVSCAFGSSFGDHVTVDDVASVCRSLGDLGVDRVTLADTTGTATPARIAAVLGRTVEELSAEPAATCPTCGQPLTPARPAGDA